MYCSSCGAVAAQGLSYCKHCGAELGLTRRDGNIRSEPKPEMMVGAMVFTFLIGIAAVICLLQVMKGLDPSDAALVRGLAALSFLLLLMLEGFFAWLLLRRRKADARAGGDDAPAERHTTKELVEPTPRALPEQMPSVTEHTTRTFEPVFAKRKQGD